MVGSGNVATHLSIAFEKAGHAVQAVYSRQLAHAQALARKLQNAVASDSLNFSSSQPADIYLLCLNDAAIPEVINQMQFPPDSLVVHTSGSLSMNVLFTTQKFKKGVFYPVQTFSKNQAVDLANTPIAIEAEDDTTVRILQDLAHSISSSVFSLSSQDRKILHLAAVFACNFTNHLLGISQEILQGHGLDPVLLKPLVESTITKAMKNNPYEVQTGPAVRGDQNIMQAQMQFLAPNTNYQQLYKLISLSIQNQKK